LAQGSITGASWLSRARLVSPPGVQGVLLGVFAGGLAGAVTVIAAISFAAPIIAGRSGHHIQLEQPDLVSAATRQRVRRNRGNRVSWKMPARLGAWRH